MAKILTLEDYIENKLDSPSDIMERAREGFKLLREEQEVPPKLEE